MTSYIGNSPQNDQEALFALLGDIPTKGELIAALAGKADTGHTHAEYGNLNSPEFTGVPKVPTATSGNNSTQIANTEFVQTAVSSAVQASLIPNATTSVYGKVIFAEPADHTSSDKVVSPAILKSGLDSKSDSTHTHTGYAASTHSHSEYAASTHTHSGYQTALGFTPVQQGGGGNQGTNKLYLGWRTDGTLGLQVDSTDFGPKWPINISGESVKEGTVRHIVGNPVGYKLVDYDNGINTWNVQDPVSATRPERYSTATAEQSRQNGQTREVFFADIERASGRRAIVQILLKCVQAAPDADRAICMYFIPKNSSGYDFSVTPIAVWGTDFNSSTDIYWYRHFEKRETTFAWMPVSDTGIVAIGIYFNYLTWPGEYEAGDYSVMLDGLVTTTIINNGV